MMGFDHWFYEEGSRRAGPVELAEVQELAAAGVIQPDMRVWRPAVEAWVRAADAPELAASLAAAPPPVPAAGDGLAL